MEMNPEKREALEHVEQLGRDLAQRGGSVGESVIAMLLSTIVHNTDVLVCELRELKATIAERK